MSTSKDSAAAAPEASTGDDESKPKDGAVVHCAGAVAALCTGAITTPRAGAAASLCACAKAGVEDRQSSYMQDGRSDAPQTSTQKDCKVDRHSLGVSHART